MEKAEMTFKLSPDILAWLICVLLSSVIIRKKKNTLQIQCFPVVSGMNGCLECFHVLQFCLDNKVVDLVHSRVSMA